MRQRNLITDTKGLLLVFALISFALNTTLLAQDPKPPSATPPGPTIQLSLIVTDKNNKAVNVVSKEDIRLVEDKVDQTVLSVEPDTRPVDLGIAIDASGSFRRLIDSTIEAARLIIVNRRAEDQIFLERFISTDKIEKLHNFSNDVSSLNAALDSIRIEGGQSAVIDAVYTAANYVANHNRNSDRRKVLVVFSDGEDRNSSYNLDKLLKLLHQEKIQIFVVGLTMDLSEQARITGKNTRDKSEKLLRTLAEETGGRVFFPRDKSELGEPIAQIVHDLRGQFRITYQSSNGDKKDFRNVDVKLISPSDEKRKAIVPRGYVTP